MFDQLELLHTSRTNWKVKVRITRMWPSFSADGNNTFSGYNIIILDDDNYHMQGYIYPDKWSKIQDSLNEGDIYIITIFSVKEATLKLRPVFSKYVINFINSTTVEKLLEDDFMIPTHKFEFYDLTDLFDLASANVPKQPPDYATDIIGAVEKYENLETIPTKIGQRAIVQFRISNGRISHRVTVWGKLAETTEKEYQRERDLERPVIAIVASAKLEIFKKSLQINTLPSSKIYFNLDNYAVNEMRKRLEKEGFKSEENDISADIVSNDVQVIETMTLKELTEKTSTEYAKRNVLCKAKISKVHETDNWWFIRCFFCQQEVYNLEERFKCLKCRRNMPSGETRYKIKVVAEDSIQAVDVILHDRAIKRLVGKTASTMINELGEAASKISIPQSIMDIVGKDLTLNIMINEENVLISSRMYDASDAYLLKESKSICSDSIQEIPNYTISSSPDNGELAVGNTTPGSARPCNKKIKLEK